MDMFVKKKQQLQQVQRQLKSTTDQQRSHVQLDRSKNRSIDRPKNPLKNQRKNPQNDQRENHDQLVDRKLELNSHLFINIFNTLLLVTFDKN